MSDPLRASLGIPRNEVLERLLQRSKERWEAMSPTERAIESLRQKVSYVRGEMELDVNDNPIRTPEEASAIVNRSEPALLLAEIDRLQKFERDTIPLTLSEASLLVIQIRKAMTGQGFSLEHIGKLHEITGRMADEIKTQIGE